MKSLLFAGQVLKVEEPPARAGGVKEGLLVATERGV